MTFEFFAAAALAALFAYAPLYMLLRSIGVGRAFSLCCAPFAASALYGVLCIAYERLGVAASWETVALPAVGVGAVLLIVRAVRSRFAGGACCADGRGCGAGTRRSARMRSGARVRRVLASDGALLALYVAVGIVVCSLVFLANIGSPNAFEQEFDNIHHLGVTRSFVDSGNWSPFCAILYNTSADAAINPLPDPAFYPSAWNWFTSLVVDALGVSVPVAANAVNFVFSGVVYPASMFLFMRTVFADARGVVAAGALITPAFSVFPWLLMSYGPLYPNMVAYAMVPAIAACFVVLLGPDVARPSRLRAGALVLVGAVACLFSQPNAAFALAVMLAPYCVYRSFSLVDFVCRARSLSPSRTARVLARICTGALVALAIAGVWYACYRMPFMQAVVNYNWPAISTWQGAVESALSLAFRTANPQPLLAVLVAAGTLVACVRRRYLWMACGYVMACAIYAVDASQEGPLKHLLAGFWYTDTLRIAAFACIAAVPLAALGLSCAARAAACVAGRIACALAGGKASREEGSRSDDAACNAGCESGAPVAVRAPRATRVTQAAVAGVCAAALALAVYDLGDPTAEDVAQAGSALGEAGAMITRTYSSADPAVYDSKEREFVRKVKEVVPEDALIVNVADDGSAFAYSVDGLRVYYRYLSTYGLDNETNDSKIIRTSMSSYATNEMLRRALDKIGARYVLLLDQGEWNESRKFLFTYEDGKKWRGFRDITDGTPGFQVVLAEGDMRVYKLDEREVVR